MKNKLGMFLYVVGSILFLMWAYFIIWSVAIRLYGGVPSFVKVYSYEGHFFAPPFFGVILKYYDHFLVNTIVVLAIGTIIGIVAEKMTKMYD